MNFIQWILSFFRTPQTQLAYQLDQTVVREFTKRGFTGKRYRVVQHFERARKQKIKGRLLARGDLK